MLHRDYQESTTATPHARPACRAYLAFAGDVLNLSQAGRILGYAGGTLIRTDARRQHAVVARNTLSECGPAQSAGALLCNPACRGNLN
jgi:hypothetical protein